MMIERKKKKKESTILTVHIKTLGIMLEFKLEPKL